MPEELSGRTWDNWKANTRARRVFQDLGLDDIKLPLPAYNSMEGDKRCAWCTGAGKIWAKGTKGFGYYSCARCRGVGIEPGVPPATEGWDEGD